MKFDLATFLAGFRFLPMPKYYDQWVQAFNEMIVHTRKVKPDDILLKARPHEDPEVTQYRLDNYRAVTYPSMIKSYDRLFRIFNALSFSWDAPQVVKDYIKNNKFNKETFPQYMGHNVLKNTVDDANGLVVWLPDGEGLTEETKPVQP